MGNAKHTPGPWALCEQDGTIRSPVWGKSDQMADYLGVIVCDLSPALGAWPSMGRRHAEPETRANAALIAAAPDLLAACKAVLAGDPEGRGLRDQVLEQVVAAIAKAEGG